MMMTTILTAAASTPNTALYCVKSVRSAVMLLWKKNF